MIELSLPILVISIVAFIMLGLITIGLLVACAACGAYKIRKRIEEKEKMKRI